VNASELIDRTSMSDLRRPLVGDRFRRVDCATAPLQLRFPCIERLAVILGAYTVYLDLWLCDLEGNVLANGRADRFNVVGQKWRRPNGFPRRRDLRSATTTPLATSNASQCSQCPGLTYCASVRAGGKANAKPIGVLAMSFSTGNRSARAIVQAYAVGAADKARVLLVESNFG